MVKRRFNEKIQEGRTDCSDHAQGSARQAQRPALFGMHLALLYPSPSPTYLSLLAPLFPHVPCSSVHPHTPPSPPVYNLIHCKVQVDLPGSTTSAFLLAHQAVWRWSLFLVIVSLFCQVCISAYFVSGFPLFPLVSYLTGLLIRLSHWNKHSHTPMCPHQCVWLTRFGSCHCLPYHLSARCVPLHILVYGFLLSYYLLKNILGQIPLEKQTLSLHTPIDVGAYLTWVGRSWTSWNPWL